jgi:arylsulfatase
VEFTPSGKPGGGGTLELTINGEPAGRGLLKGSSFRHGLEPFEIGRDSITPVDPAYRERGTFPFSGTIKRVQFRVLP